MVYGVLRSLGALDEILVAGRRGTNAEYLFLQAK